MGNYSSTNFEVLPCFLNDIEMCYQPFNYTNNAMNLGSLVLNILHLLILFQITELKNTKYFWSILNITLVDVEFSIIMFFYFSCEVRVAIYKLSAISMFSLFLAIQVLTAFAVISRYSVLIMASIERYVAVCRPHEYKTNYIVRKIKICFGLTIALTFLYSILICVTHLPLPELCRSQLKVTFASGRPLILTYGLLTIPIVSASLVITILLVKVWRKLRIMTKKPIGGQRNKTLLAASKYIISIYIMHQLLNVLLLIYTTLQLSNFSTSIFIIEIVSTFCVNLYGVANVILFAYFHPKYVSKIKSILRIDRCSNQVQPDTS